MDKQLKQQLDAIDALIRIVRILFLVLMAPIIIVSVTGLFINVNQWINDIATFTDVLAAAGGTALIIVLAGGLYWIAMKLLNEEKTKKIKQYKD